MVVPTATASYDGTMRTVGAAAAVGIGNRHLRWCLWILSRETSPWARYRGGASGRGFALHSAPLSRCWLRVRRFRFGTFAALDGCTEKHFARWVQ